MVRLSMLFAGRPERGAATSSISRPRRTPRPQGAVTTSTAAEAQQSRAAQDDGAARRLWEGKHAAGARVGDPALAAQLVGHFFVCLKYLKSGGA